MAYVDGFVIPVKKDRLEDYKKLARLAETVWKEYGARAYVECVADDVPQGELTSFWKAVQAGDDEVVVFSWIVYDSRAHRDGVNDKVMRDPRMDMDPSNLPFDSKWMIWGGFTPFVGP